MFVLCFVIHSKILFNINLLGGMCGNICMCSIFTLMGYKCMYLFIFIYSLGFAILRLFSSSLNFVLISPEFNLASVWFSVLKLSP